jgi:hypothetical protein
MLLKSSFKGEGFSHITRGKTLKDDAHSHPASDSVEGTHLLKNSLKIQTRVPRLDSSFITSGQPAPEEGEDC